MGESTPHYIYFMKDLQDREYERSYLQDRLNQLNAEKEKLEAELTDEEGEFIYDGKPRLELRLLGIYRDIQDLENELKRL